VKAWCSGELQVVKVGEAFGSTEDGLLKHQSANKSGSDWRLQEILTMRGLVPRSEATIPHAAIAFIPICQLSFHGPPATMVSTRTLMVATSGCEGRSYSYTLRTGPCCKTHPTRQSRAPHRALSVKRIPAVEKWRPNRMDNGCLRLRQMVIKSVRHTQPR
jgi:hypothetical protein